MNTLCERHESSIRNDKDHPVAIHYRSYCHTFDDYNLTIMDKENDKNKRFRLEEAWMILVDTITPKCLDGR